MTSEMQVKLAGLETGADVTDAANVSAAGALMSADVTSAGLAMIQANSAADQLSLLLTLADASQAKAAVDTAAALTPGNLADYLSPQTLTSSGNATTFDVALGVNAVLSLGEDTTVTFANARPGQSGFVIISHSGGSAHTVAWTGGAVETGSITADDTKRNRCSWTYSGTEFFITIGADVV
jgi:hypothetical protein